MKTAVVINTERYCDILYDCLMSPCIKNSHDISYELIGAQVKFLPKAHINKSSEAYIKHELEWYMSQDLCIKGHDGIENNKVWKSCASRLGFVNSNYGWCIFSEQNNNQLEYAVRSLCRDLMTKQAIMVYTRPSIQTECCDGVHANYDMICTCYTNTFVRDKKLIHCVHMRSNDIWFGLRNDLAWQQWVQEHVLARCREYQPEMFKDIELGNIIWNADSLHLYDRNYAAAVDFMREKGYLV